MFSALITIGMILGCNKEPAYTPVSQSDTRIYEFWLEKTESNPNLKRAYPGMIVGDSAIRLMVDYGTDITALEPTIISGSDSIFPKGKQNFTSPVNYTLWANGKAVTYTVRITVSTVQNPVIKSVASGFAHIIAIKTDGTVWACGSNSSGQLGLGDYSNRNKLTQVPVYNAEQAFTGDAATIIKLKDGSAWGVGNEYGQLGLGNKNPIARLTRVPYFDNVTQIAITFGEVFVVKPDGTVWGAGRNWEKILAQPDADLHASFVKVPIENVKSISGNGLEIIVQKNNGEIWGWGKNNAGQLGLSDNLPHATPVKIASLSNKIAKVFAGASVFLIDSSGTVWASGPNLNAQLGLGDQTNRNVFTQVSFFDNKPIETIVSRFGATSFMEKNGTVWNVGSNSTGLMGQGNLSTLPYLTPVQLPNFTASTIAGFGNAAFALSTDGTLWGWGNNSGGVLGTGTAIVNLSSPTQLK